MGKGDRLHHVYYGMISRCYNPNNPSYKFYNPKGITVCEEWLTDYSKFKEWALENGYDYSKSRKDQSLDRIDNGKGYSPYNCRWVSHSENCKNTSRNIWLTYNGKTMVLMDWSKETGIPYKTIQRRLKNTNDFEKIFCSESRAFQSNTGIKGISYIKSKDWYSFSWNHKYIGIRKTLEEAIKLKEEYLSEINR